MPQIEVELTFEAVIATEIEDAEGNYFDNSEDDFETHRLKGTEDLDADTLTQFVKENLEVVFDGTLDSPDHFKSYEVFKVEGPSFASYDGGFNISDLSVYLNVEIALDDPDDVDFDDLFHAIVFQLSDGEMTITFTEFESYGSNVLTE